MASTAWTAPTGQWPTLREVRQTMRDAMRSPVVLAVAIVCGTILGLGLLGSLAWLAYVQRDATTIMTLVNSILSIYTLKRVSDVDGRVRIVETQTNGHTTRLMNVALRDKE